jgi:hypothetical protein
VSPTSASILADMMLVSSPKLLSFDSDLS